MYDEDKNHFTISDPVLVSSTPMGGVFGPTDFGNAAINLFFLNYSSQWHSVSKTWYKDTIGLVSDISAKSMVHKKSKTKELSSSQSSSAQILRITAKNTMIYLKQIDNFLSDLEYLDGNLFNSTIENFAEQIREIKENAPKSVFQSC